MFELRDLYQLIKIADCGTISRAADELYISQPALSRAMQKLEGELGVALFDRAKNKVELNENGKFFVGIARSLISECEDGARRLRDFDRERKTFVVGACAPAPLWELMRILGSNLPEGRIATEICPDDRLLRGLLSGAYSLVVLSAPADFEGVVCRFLCSERLLLCLPPEHRLAGRKQLTFADIDGITMLLYEGIGVWGDVRSRLPHTRFIVQSGFEDFADLVRQSTLPSFTTDLSFNLTDINGRTAVPVVGEGSEHNFYVCAPLKYKNLLPPERRFEEQTQLKGGSN